MVTTMRSETKCPHCGSYINIREAGTRCTECGKELFNSKKENMKSVFKKGDKVFHINYQWGEVESVESIKSARVMFNGILRLVDINLLSFTEYTLQGLTQEKPFEPEIGKFYWFWNEGAIENNCVGRGKYLGKSNDELAPYKFGDNKFPFCSENNPLE
jgi:DNA-directed RNA polymerase subunit RPC12/RpoP